MSEFSLRNKKNDPLLEDFVYLSRAPQPNKRVWQHDSCLAGPEGGLPVANTWTPHRSLTQRIFQTR